MLSQRETLRISKIRSLVLRHSSHLSAKPLDDIILHVLVGGIGSLADDATRTYSRM